MKLIKCTLSLSLMFMLPIFLTGCADGDTPTNDDLKKIANNTVVNTLGLDSETPLTILFVGNSYTSYNDLPDLFSQMSDSKGRNVAVSSVTPGGYRFKNHAEDNDTISIIQSQQWDQVILQNQSQVPGLMPSEVITSSLPYAQALVNLIKANQQATEVIYFVTWGRLNGDSLNCGYYPLICDFDGHTEALKTGYTLYQASTGGSLSLVGDAWKSVMDDNNAPFDATELWSADGSHPSIYGSYLTAAVLFTTIFDESPVYASYPDTLSEAIALYLQQVAAEGLLEN